MKAFMFTGLVCLIALYLGTTVWLTVRVNRVAYQNCVKIEHLKAINRRALLEAINRAEASLPGDDPRLDAAVRELDAEIKLLRPASCQRL